MPIDVTRSNLPESKSKTFYEQAEELLARLGGVNRAQLLAEITASYLMDFKYGNKREEREACNFLNQLQLLAFRKADSRATEAPNDEGKP